MRASSDEERLDAEAARIALVALAAIVPSYEPLDEDRVRIAPDAAVLACDSAARLLASMPKPLICRARSVDGVLDVKCELLAEAGYQAQQQFERHRELGSQQGGPFAELLERNGESDSQLIAVKGRGKLICVSLAGVRRWMHDYEVTLVSWTEIVVENELMSEDAGHAEARRQGARGILSFYSPASRVQTMDGHVYAFPLPESASPEDRARVERTLVERARLLLVELSEEEEMEAVGRELVERGEIPADSMESAEVDRTHSLHHVLTSQLQKLFEGREMPAECVAFIDACRLS